jgi:hypothetical protein
MTFLWNRMVGFVVGYLFMDGIASLPPAAMSLMSVEKEGLLAPLRFHSTGDLAFRIAASIMYWFGGYILISLVGGAIALVFVATRLSTPAANPPLFGEVKEAYTMRGFWGSFWHQCLWRGLSTHADYVVDKVLCLERGTLLSRYSRIFATFFLSGLHHMACEGAAGVPSEQRGLAVQFFTVQTVGIVVEDAVQTITGGLRIRPWVKRVVGRLWVAMFLAWTTPLWMFLQQRVGTDAVDLLPVRVVMTVVGMIKRMQ